VKEIFAKIKGLFIIIEFVITVITTIALLYLFPKKGHKIRQTWAKMQTYIMGFKIKVIGEPDLDAKLLLMNHQSVVDIIALEAIYPKDECWVAKKEIGEIPIFGHILRAPKMIAIDRKDKRSMVKIIKTSKERINEGRVISMFPEGTRGKGDKLLKFQNGAKILAEKLNLKVQPIVIVNSRYIFDSKKITAHSGQMSVIYLDSINPKDDENWFEKMKEEMSKRLKDELANYTSNR
jgi:1-acyl-sn-glycerol-3-phosphate acyltransferase